MNKQRKEEIKKAAISLGKKILIGGIGCLIWTGTMLLTILIVIDPNNGILAFTQINSWLYKLYATLVGIGLFIFFVERVIPKSTKQAPEVIVENPRKQKKK